MKNNFLFSLFSLLFFLSACGGTVSQADYGLEMEAKSGAVAPQYLLGKSLVESGKKQEGMMWLCKAAFAGYSPAQSEIGNVYRSDKNKALKKSEFPNDDVLAYAWYSIAAANKNANAAGIQYEIASRLSFDELKKAKKMVADYPILPCEIKE